ncbi:MAG: hypothetical protein HZB38_04365 [Planctomycetes bacterium]|nr:hypothetical protein [Planctomycetota bacterium]
MNSRIVRTASVLVGLLAVSTVFATTWYVDKDTPAPRPTQPPTPNEQNGRSWLRAYEDLQLLFDREFVQPGDEIWIANGVYKPSAHPDEPFDGRAATYRIPRAVRVYGGFAGVTELDPDGEDFRNERNPEVNLTTLSGDILGNDDGPDAGEDPDHFPDNSDGIYNDNVYHVVSIADTMPEVGPTVLSGFIIIGGYANGLDTPHTRGGGVCSRLAGRDPGEPVGGVQFNRLKLRYNYASNGGGGIYVTYKDISFKFANCSFEHNFTDDYDGGGGLLSAYVVSELANCLFYDNHTTNSPGGGAAIIGLTPNENTLNRVQNCTFGGNSAPSWYGGGGLYTDALTPPPNGNPGTLIANSILWDNTPNQIEQPYNSVIVANSNVQGTSPWPGTCNINTDPLFANSAAGDLHLSLTSPAIDVGNAVAVPPDWTDVNDNSTTENPIPWDLDTEVRIMPVPDGAQPCHVDMGAYENRCICAVGDIDRDGDVDLQDLAYLLGCFGMPFTCTDTNCYLSDVDCNGVVELQDLSFLLSDFGTICCPSLAGGEGGESMMSGDDPLTEWLRSAAPQDVLDWWFAGQPPVGGGDR